MQLASRFASRSPSLRSDYPLSDDQIHRVARPSSRTRRMKAVRSGTPTSPPLPC